MTVDLYEKLAFSTQARYGLGGVAIGGALGAGLGYISPDEKMVKKDPNIRWKAMAVDGALMGLMGGLTGYEVGDTVHHTRKWEAQRAAAAQDSERWRQQAEERAANWSKSWKEKIHEEDPYWEDVYQRVRDHVGHTSAAPAPDATGWTPPPKVRAESPTTARTAASAFDPTHHGKGVGRMWDGIINSKEIADPAKERAAVAFMKSVGRPGANPDELKQHMEHFHQDTLTKQMMNVLFNKFHAPKEAAYHAAMKLAAWDVYAAYGIW